ncbi:MAG: phosphoglycerate dehydrogenase [Nocardioidaceae bacterium]
MRVLFADATSPDTITALTAQGHECVLEPDLKARELPDRVVGFDVLVVRSTKVTAAVIEGADRLELIVRAGAGTNTIDTQAAAARGVLVANVPGRNSIAVAELTMGLLLAIDRAIPDNVADARAGRWDKKRHSRANGLFGSSLGIVGLGDIGLAVAERAASFGIVVRAVSKPTRSAATEARIASIGIEAVDSLRELVSGCDAVSLHVPAAAETRGLVDTEFLGWMRPGAILINTSRGDVVDEAALLTALDERGLRAGLDVYADEPATGHGPWESRLAAHPSVLATHHIGASTEQAQRAIAAGVVDVVAAFARGEPMNCVNLAPLRIGSATISIRHLDRVGVLADVFELLGRARINVEHMENRIFEGGQAAVAIIDVAGPLEESLIAGLREVDNVLSVSVTRLHAAAG